MADAIDSLIALHSGQADPIDQAIAIHSGQIQPTEQQIAPQNYFQRVGSVWSNSTPQAQAEIQKTATGDAASGGANAMGALHIAGTIAGAVSKNIFAPITETPPVQDMYKDIREGVNGFIQNHPKIAQGIHDFAQRYPNTLRAMGDMGNILGMATVGTGIVKTTVPITTQIMDKGIGRFASELSGVSEEALRKYGTGMGQGAKELAAAAGTQQQIGADLVHTIRNWDNYIPEMNTVKAALPNMPPIKIDNLVNTLEKAKKPNAVLAESKAVNAQIDNKINEIKQAGGKLGTLYAEDALNLRKELDGIVEDQFGKESNSYLTALKQGRHTIATDLINSAKTSGNDQYITAMQSLSNKMQKVDNLKQWLGKNATVQDSRAQQFISTLFGKNKAARQQVVSDISDIFGGNFQDRAKMASLAQELGDNGAAGWIPKQTTGKSALGAVGTMAALAATHGNPAATIPILLSSPKIAAATLATTGKFKTLGQMLK